MLAATVIGAILLAGPLVLQSLEYPEVVINVDTDGLCVWVPETARDCPPAELQRFKSLEAEAKAEAMGAPLLVAFVREPGDEGELALIIHSIRPPEPHIEGDDPRFGSAQVELLCDRPTSCEYSMGEIDGVATFEISESLPNRAYSMHTVFRGKEATVYTTLRGWPYDSPRYRTDERPRRWRAKLNGAISVSPAPLEAEHQPRRKWLPSILQIVVGLSAIVITIAIRIARVRASRR